MQQYVEVTQNVLLTVSWVGGLAAAISLVVGGIGIMNMMTATVVERTREIGMRKALGATHGDVVWQFLMESVLVSLFGGMVGTGVGIGLIHVIELISKKPISLAPLYVLVAFSVSFVVGICSGIYPAIRAATMDPVDALRTE
jgi:putative ABC transport system permease protein